MRKSTRKPIAILALFVIMLVWVVAAATVGTQMTAAPRWLQLGFYIVAGIGWVVLIRPIFIWMNSGPD